MFVAIIFVVGTILAAIHATVSKAHMYLLFYSLMDVFVIAFYSTLFKDSVKEMFVAGIVALVIDIFCFTYAIISE